MWYWSVKNGNDHRIWLHRTIWPQWQKMPALIQWNRYICLVVVILLLLCVTDWREQNNKWLDESMTHLTYSTFIHFMMHTCMLSAYARHEKMPPRSKTGTNESESEKHLGDSLSCEHSGDLCNSLQYIGYGVSRCNIIRVGAILIVIRDGCSWVGWCWYWICMRTWNARWLVLYIVHSVPLTRFRINFFLFHVIFPRLDWFSDAKRDARSFGYDLHKLTLRMFLVSVCYILLTLILCCGIWIRATK